MTTKPQQSAPTKTQRRLARRQEAYDAMMSRSGQHPDPAAYHRPGSGKKSMPVGGRKSKKR